MLYNIKTIVLIERSCVRKNMKKYPELLWLTGDVNATPEGINTKDDKYREYNRTMLSIELLRYVILEDYERFTEYQKPKRLSKEKFKEICEYTKSIVKTKDDLEAIITYLIINDLGKIKNVVNDIKSKIGLQTVDHDDILFQGLKNVPGISPSFDELDRNYKQLILNGLNTNFNMGQFIRSENLPQNLIPLVNLDEESFDFYMLHVLYDIGGATGHITRKGTIIIDDDFWNKFKISEKYLKEMNEEKDVLPAYNAYLNDRKSVLQLQGEGDEITSTVKICNMLGTSDPHNAQMILESLENQEKNIKENLLKELTATGINSDNAILLYYAPATFLNAINYLKNEKSGNPISEGLNIVLPTLSRIYSQTRLNINKKDNIPDITTVMISDVAKKAGENPYELLKSDFEIQSVGDDFEVIVVPEKQIKNTQKKDCDRDCDR